MFEMNNWAMTSQNPMKEYVDHVATLTSQQKQQVIDAVGGQEQWELFVNCSNYQAEGTGENISILV